jgi:hypothetical protein
LYLSNGYTGCDSTVNRVAKIRQVETIAGKLAEMLELGQNLVDGYTFKAGQLTPGLLK